MATPEFIEVTRIRLTHIDRENDAPDGCRELRVGYNLRYGKSRLQQRMECLGEP
jgi:hypothetical protein